MAIFVIGACCYDDDVSEECIYKGLIGSSWTRTNSSELHNYLGILKSWGYYLNKSGFLWSRHNSQRK